jgi:hypothetical protein
MPAFPLELMSIIKEIRGQLIIQPVCKSRERASATTAKTPARWGQQCQRNDAKELMAMTPMQWGWRQYDDSGDIHANMAMTPMQSWQWCPCNGINASKHDKGNDPSAMLAKTQVQWGQQPSNNASVTRAMKPMQRQRRQCNERQCIKGNNPSVMTLENWWLWHPCNRDDSSMITATTPMQIGQWRPCKNGNDAHVMALMPASATKAMIPA